MWKGIFNEEKEGKEMGKKAEKTLPSNNVFGLYSLQRQVPHNKLPGPGLLGCRKRHKRNGLRADQPAVPGGKKPRGDSPGLRDQTKRGEKVPAGYQESKEGSRDPDDRGGKINV